MASIEEIERVELDSGMVSSEVRSPDTKPFMIEHEVDDDDEEVSLIFQNYFEKISRYFVEKNLLTLKISNKNFLQDETLGERLYGLTEMFPESIRNLSYNTGVYTKKCIKGMKTSKNIEELASHLLFPGFFRNIWLIMFPDMDNIKFCSNSVYAAAF